MAFYQSGGGLRFGAGHLEHELIVHLQHHPSREAPLAQRGVNADHRDLDQVGGRALQGGVRGGPLTECPDVEVLVLELGDVAPPAEQRLDVAPLPGLGDCAVEPGAHAGEAAEVLLNERARLVLRDAQLAGQREGALPINGGEVDRLGPRAHLRGHLLLGHAEDDGRCLAVDIPALSEGGDKGRIAGEVGQKPQLDLRVVGGQEHGPRRRHERAADRLSPLGAHGDVLQVGVRAREPSRRRPHRIEARVHPSR